MPNVQLENHISLVEDPGLSGTGEVGAKTPWLGRGVLTNREGVVGCCTFEFFDMLAEQSPKVSSAVRKSQGTLSNPKGIASDSPGLPRSRGATLGQVA